jgi:hypothetical protein
MDDRRFDRWSRQIGKQTDRRAMLKTVAAGAVALLGAGVVRRDAAAAGYNGDFCNTGADCQTGLLCEPTSSGGLLGGLLSSGLYGPPGTASLFSGPTGRCRYRDSCGKSGQSCQDDSDCCNGLNLRCHNNTCKR